MMPRKRKVRIAEGSGNVFADLGLENPDEELLRAELVLQLVRAIRALGITQAEAAKRLAVDAAKISALVNGKLAGFSIARLLRFLTLLGRDSRSGRARRGFPAFLGAAAPQTRPATGRSSLSSFGRKSECAPPAGETVTAGCRGRFDHWSPTKRTKSM
jgi:predicted XRE-type DNA-binding protein